MCAVNIGLFRVILFQAYENSIKREKYDVFKFLQKYPECRINYYYDYIPTTNYIIYHSINRLVDDM